MRKCLWGFLLGLGFVIAAQSYVFAIDPPHSPNSAVNCGECHGNALFPLDTGGMTSDELRQAYNTMCKRCHISNDGSYHGNSSPYIKPHDSNTGLASNYTFQTGCQDCHHPHLQTNQVYWGRRTLGSPGQLFRGVVDSVQYWNFAKDQQVSKDQAAFTKIIYNPALLTVKTGSIWDTTDGVYPPTQAEPDGAPGETIDIELGLHYLENKMYGLDDNMGRGAIFLPFYRSHYESRMIETIDIANDAIWLKGTISANYETYMQTPGYGFAIYYGLAMNLSVRHPSADPNRPVYFFDRTGEYGFAHQDFCDNTPPSPTPPCTDSTPYGICQACHTETVYFKNDGTGLWHFNGSDCMECHAHSLGFKAAGTVDHTADPIYLEKSPVECTGCHDPNLDLQYVMDIHQGDCEACHLPSSQLVRTDYGTPNTIDLSVDYSDCADCHENGSTVKYLTDFANTTYGHRLWDHSGLTGNTGAATVTESCFTASYCHTYSSKTDIAEVMHDACTDCHVNTGSDGRLIDGANNYGDATGHVIYTTSSCNGCHAADGYFDAHTHPTHDTVHLDGTDQSNGTNCENCHQSYNSNDLDTWTAIFFEHQDSCVLCHNATRDINPGSPTGITVQDRIASGSGNKVSPTECLHCHADRSATHMPDHVATGMVTGTGTSCVPCHDPYDINTENHYLITVHTACGICHVTGTGGGELHNYLSTGGTIDEYVNYEGIDGNPDPTYEGGSCNDCHVNYSNNFGAEHQVVSHSLIEGNGNCTSCHSGDIITAVHATPGCTDCHVNSTTDGSLANKTYGDATLHIMGSTSDCAACHGATGGYNYDSDFGGAHTNFDHETTGALAAVTISSACTNTCHSQTTAADIVTITHLDNCIDCHINTDSDGSLHAGNVAGSIGDATSYGTAANHAFDSTSSCVDCHENGSTLTYQSDYGGANGHRFWDHDGLTGTTSATPVDNCSNSQCHLSGTKTEIASTTHTACAECHQADGDLVGSQPQGTTVGHVIGTTSNCLDCHSAYDGNFETHIYSDATDHAPGGSGSTVYQLASDLTNGETCDNCHGSTLTDWSNVYDLHNVDTNGAGACATCHNSARGTDTDGGGIQAIIHAGEATNPCLSCHQSASEDHSDHVATGWVYGNNECTSCHDEAGAADQNQYIVVIHNNDCSMCHTNPGSNDYSLKSLTSAADHTGHSTNTCSDCHNGAYSLPDYASDFTSHTAQNHTWVGSNAECSDCHTGDVVNLDGSFDVHNDNCENCHVNTGTDGSLHAGDDINSYGGGTSYGTATYDGGLGHVIGTTSTCSDCHASYSASFTTGHQNEDHVNLLSTPSSCTSCHDLDMITGANTHSDACTYCHVNTDTDGRLVAGAQGTATGDVGDATVHTWGSTSSCAKCHPNYNASFTTGHQNEDHADLVTSSNCDGCHSGDMITGTDTHNDACAYCHVNTDTDGSLVNGAAGTAAGDVGDATLHGWGTTSSCNDCHENGSSYTYATDFDNTSTGHRLWDHDGLTGTTSSTLIYDCNNCHAAATKVEIAETTHTTCDTCHVNTGANGELWGARTTGTTQTHTIGGTSNCVDCHGATGGYNYDTIFENHIYSDNTANHAPGGTGNTVYQLAGTDEMAGTACDACHGSTLTDWVNVYALHNVDTNGPGACATCHNSTSDDADEVGGVQDVIHSNDTTNPCISCHVSKAADHADHILAGWVLGYTECGGCHDQSVEDEAHLLDDIHGDGDTADCTMCHTDPSGGDYSLKAGSSAEGPLPGNNTCVTCHSAYQNAFGSAHVTVDHQTEAYVDIVTVTASCTDNCHTGNTITTVHNPDCMDCHVNTTTDGRLVSNATNGTAGDHAIDSTSSCLDCHENGGTYRYLSDFDDDAPHNGHKVRDHDGLTGTTNSTDPEYSCNGCHAAATKVQIAETTHSLCANCHDANGDLVGAATNGSTAGHVMGATSNCVDCHSTRGADFEAHSHGTATNHKTGGSGTTVLEDTTASPNGDRSQETGALCSSCHVDYDDQQSASDVLQTWRSIVYEHDLDGTKDGDGACVTCHNATRDVCADGAKCTTGVNTIPDVIAANGDPTNCVDCHESQVDSTSSAATHGGHNDSQFGWAGGCEACHGAGAAAESVVQGIHGGDCDLCHTTSPGVYTKDTDGPGPSANGIDGNAYLANGSADYSPKFDPTVYTCETCHPFAGGGGGLNTRPDAHHVATPNSYAVNGTCINCHQPDVGQNGVSGHEARGDLQMPANLACNYCHLWWPNEAYTGSPVNIYNLDWDPNGATANLDAGSAAMSTHAISTNATTPVSDYAACFACHGAASYTGSNGTAPQVFPFHGYGADGDEVYTGDTTCYGSGACGGAAADMINIYGSPTITGTDHGLSHLANKGRHPGFNSLNLLEPFLSLVPSGANPGKGDVYNGSSSNKKMHQADSGQYEAPALNGTTTFNVPWDNYAPAYPTAAGTVSIDAEYNHSTHTDVGETHTVDTILRTVPLDSSTW